MANEVKQPTLQQRIAERQAKRAEVGKEAQVRIAAAWTIAKTMLPTAPVSVQKKFASSLLSNSTKILKAALRQTAINTYYTKVAETLKEVHKVEMNQLLEDPSSLNKAKNEVKSELKGDAKSANAKVADDREAAGPQPKEYNDGTPASGDREYKEDKRMDASGSQTRPADTVDKSEGSEGKTEDAVQDSARAEVTGTKTSNAKKADIMGGSPAPAAPAVAKPAAPAPKPSASPASTAPNPVTGRAEIRASDEKEAATEKESNFGSDGKHNEGQVLQTRTQTASKKKVAEEPPAPDAEAPAGELPAEEELAPESPMEEAPAEALQQDEALENVKEKVEETQQAVQQLEQELSTEKGEELDLTGLGDAAMAEGEPAGDLEMQDIFSDENINAHKSNLANEHHESSEDDFFGPSASSDMESSLDEAQFASLDQMFAHEASADPLASLFEKSAANVEGFEVVNSFEDAANHFKSEHGKDNRDSQTDNEENILALLTEGLPEQSDDQERVKQDATNELQKPDAKAAAAKKPVLKHIKASEGAPKAADVNIADVLFASIDAAEDLRDNPRR